MIKKQNVVYNRQHASTRYHIPQGDKKFTYGPFAFCKVMSGLYTHCMIIERDEFEDIQML